MDASDFLNILREDTSSPIYRSDIVITGDVNINSVCITREIKIERVTFKGKVNFADCCFQKPVCFTKAFFEEDVIFANTVFEDKATFAVASFQKKTLFQGAIFKQEVYFPNADFQCLANFKGVNFLRGVYFTEASFHQEANFKGVRFQYRGDFSGAIFRRKANFELVRYQSEELLKIIGRAFKVLSLKSLRLLSRKGPSESNPIKSTQFNLNTDSIAETTAPIFKRYVADQQYLREFKQRYLLIYYPWRVLTDCGRSILLCFFVSLFIASLFALAYTPSPDWMPDRWCNFWQEHGAEFQQMADKYKGKPLNFWSSFYFSIVTFTTLGFGDVVANNTFARLLVTLEVILGYGMLGLLISIVSNKFARRS